MPSCDQPFAHQELREVEFAEHSSSEGSDDDEDGKPDGIHVDDEGFWNELYCIDWFNLHNTTRRAQYFRTMARRKTEEIENLLAMAQRKNEEIESLLEHRHPSYPTEWQTRVSALSPIQFIQIVESLASTAPQKLLLNFLDSLVLPMQYESLKFLRKDLSKFAKESGPVLEIFGIDLKKDETHMKSIRSLSDKKMFTEFSCRAHDAFRMMFSRSRTMVYEPEFAVTPAAKLLRANTRERALMLKSLADAGPESKVFNTVMGCCLYHQARATIHPWTRISIFLDVLYIVTLFIGGHYFRRCLDPPKIVIVPFLLIAALKLISYVTKLIQGLRFFAWSVFTFLAKHLDFTESITFLCELGTFWVLAAFFLHETEEAIATSTGQASGLHFAQAHPNYFPFLALLRWVHLWLSVMSLQSLGVIVLPIYYAVTSKASLYFVIFLISVLIGTFESYYMFPIGENINPDAFLDVNKLINSFLKIYRLEILGDFELMDLEGVDDRVEGTVKGGFLNATIDEGEVTQVHRGVRFEFVVLSMVVTVIVMNVYIGLLSEQYSRAEKMKHQLYYQHQANVLFGELCIQDFWSDLCVSEEQEKLDLPQTEQFLIATNMKFIKDGEDASSSNTD